MLEEELKKLDHISTEEVENDIVETNKEIEVIKNINEILNLYPIENRLLIYLNGGRISKREKFIKGLTELLEYRKQKQT